jgi:hypothetical protein
MGLKRILKRDAELSTECGEYDIKVRKLYNLLLSSKSLTYPLLMFIRQCPNTSGNWKRSQLLEEKQRPAQKITKIMIFSQSMTTIFLSQLMRLMNCKAMKEPISKEEVLTYRESIIANHSIRLETLRLLLKKCILLKVL